MMTPMNFMAEFATASSFLSLSAPMDVAGVVAT
jgi:hypothetical protein